MSDNSEEAAILRRERQDHRKTSAEKLEKLREIANEMVQVAAREPDNEAMQKLARYSERINRVLDGEFT